MRRAWLAGTALIAVVGAGVVSGCENAESTPAGPATAPSGAPDRDLTLELPQSDPGVSVSTLDNAGTERAVVDVVSNADGEVTAARTPSGASALRFPTFSRSKSSAAAMVRIRPAGSDWMSPGLGPFEFGVDVKLDRDSSGTVRDNGDNVLQRGLFDDGAQLKLQIDKRVPSCVVTGDQGTVMVKADLELPSDAWYRLKCVRDEDTVTVTVNELSFPDEDGQAVPGDPVVAEANGPIGRVSFLPTVPMSVGGKIDGDGDPAPRTDQFNGSLSRVYFSE